MSEEMPLRERTERECREALPKAGAGGQGPGRRQRQQTRSAPGSATKTASGTVNLINMAVVPGPQIPSPAFGGASRLSYAQRLSIAPARCIFLKGLRNRNRGGIAP